MHCMIDLETLGSKTSTVVLSIGACAFDEKGIHDKFYRVLKLDDQMARGRTLTEATLQWWAKQNYEAFKDCMFGEKVMPQEAIQEFVLFWKRNHCKKPWGNGAGFDVNIMESLFEDYNTSTPWQFWMARDLRTFQEFIMDNKKPARIGTHHNALDDSVDQANFVIEGMKRKRMMI